MKKNFNVKRKGFTLVELLIVIVVIGVLSAMMMLSSTEAVTSAKASNIVSNLRNLKTAALAFYVDNYDMAENTAFSLTTSGDAAKTAILKYMSSGAADVGSEYSFTQTGTGSSAKWYVKCKVTDTGVQGKLKGRAASVGLYKNTNEEQYNADADVFMKIR